VDDVSVRFGGVVALDQVSFTLDRGDILGLLGPNGAGRTTCFNAMTGVYRPSSGQIRFLGRPVTGLKKHEVNAAGIARTFQNIRLFPAMTALENVMAGAPPPGGAAGAASCRGVAGVRRDRQPRRTDRGQPAVQGPATASRRRTTSPMMTTAGGGTACSTRTVPTSSRGTSESRPDRRSPRQGVIVRVWAGEVEGSWPVVPGKTATTLRVPAVG
jgi:energy-coupling factor transporter ATP-binding protein EcfA2